MFFGTNKPCLCILVINVTLFSASTSNGWCLENVSLLLFGCGTAIVTGVLENKAINGHIHELEMILFYIAHCTVRGNVSEDAMEKDMA